MKPKRLLILILCSCCTYLSIQAQTKLTITRNVKFASGLRDWQNRRVDSLALDIYYPPEATSDKKYPAIVFCHGGSFIGGSKLNVSSDCDLLSQQGFALVAVDYRVGYLQDSDSTACNADTTSFMLAVYRAMQDVNASFRFINANADAYNLDTSAFFIGGTSAGATLSLWDSYINDSVAQQHYPIAYNTLGSLTTSGNSLPNNYKVKAICAMWGGLPDLGLITPQTAFPTILFKGGRDVNLPDGSGHYQGCPNYPLYIAGSGIYDPTIAAGVPCVFHYNPLGVHAAYDDIFCSENVGCFLKGLINKQPYSKYLTYYTSSCPQ